MAAQGAAVGDLAATVGLEVERESPSALGMEAALRTESRGGEEQAGEGR